MNSANRRLSILEFLLWTAGLALLGLAGYQLVRYEVFQYCPNCFTAAASTLAAPAPHTLQIAGRLDIPRLHMNVVVLNGDDEAALAVGAGFVPGTAVPGKPGNSVIAGHRDMAFRALRDIHVGDRVQFSGAHSYEYVVRRTFIVDQHDESVLRNSPGSTLTMITCYPFHYIGSAPKRFIVQAALVSSN